MAGLTWILGQAVVGVGRRTVAVEAGDGGDRREVRKQTASPGHARRLGIIHVRSVERKLARRQRVERRKLVQLHLLAIGGREKVRAAPKGTIGGLVRVRAGHRVWGGAQAGRVGRKVTPSVTVHGVVGVVPAVQGPAPRVYGLWRGRGGHDAGHTGGRHGLVRGDGSRARQVQQVISRSIHPRRESSHCKCKKNDQIKLCVVSTYTYGVS